MNEVCTGSIEGIRVDVVLVDDLEVFQEGSEGTEESVCGEAALDESKGGHDVTGVTVRAIVVTICDMIVI